MKGTIRKLILVSFVLALLAAGSVYVYLQSLNTVTVSEGMRSIYVATEMIPPRTQVQASMIKQIYVTDDPFLNQYISSTGDIIGKYATNTIQVNEGFLSNKLIDERQGGLSLRIPNGHRAVSINVPASSGVAHLLKPEDRVDVVFFGGNDISKIILQNISILAIDKQLNRNEQSSGGEMPSSFLVTLSIPNRDVEKIVLAENIGSIKLALRHAEDDGNTPTKVTNIRDLTNQSGNEE